MINQIPDGYTKEEWEAYQNDPAAYCIKELANPDSSVRYNAVDILRGLAFDAVEAIPVLSKLIEKEPDIQVRAHAVFTLKELCYYVEKDKREPTIEALNNLLAKEKEEKVIEEIVDALKDINALPVESFKLKN